MSAKIGRLLLRNFLASMPQLTLPQKAKIFELKCKGLNPAEALRVLKNQWPHQLKKLNYSTVYRHFQRSNDFLKTGSMYRKVRICPISDVNTFWRLDFEMDNVMNLSPFSCFLGVAFSFNGIALCLERLRKTACIHEVPTEGLDQGNGEKIHDPTCSCCC